LTERLVHQGLVDPQLPAQVGNCIDERLAAASTS